MSEREPGSDDRHEAERRQANVEVEQPAQRIYVASLSDYNAGRLHGAWLDAAQEDDELLAQVRTMLECSPEPVAEEWAIHDYEGFGPLRLHEFEDLRSVAAVARGLAEHGAAFAAWASLRGRLDAETLDGFEDAFLGTWASVEEYAEQLLDDVGATAELEKLPEWLQSHVRLDVEGFARDLELGGDVSCVEEDGGVHVFDGRA